MKKKTIKFTNEELDDIRFALLLESNESFLQGHKTLAESLHLIYEKIRAYQDQ